MHDRRVLVEGSGSNISSIVCFHDTFLHSVNHRATPFKDAVVLLRVLSQSELADVLPYACTVVVITASC